MLLGTLIAIKQIKFYSANVDSSGSSDLTPAMPTQWYSKFFASFGINICLILISLVSAIGFCCVRHCLYVRHEQENAAYHKMVSNDHIMDQIIGSSDSLIRSMRGSRLNSGAVGGLKFRDTVKAAEKIQQDQPHIKIGENARTMKKSEQQQKTMNLGNQPRRERSNSKIQRVFAGTESVYHQKNNNESVIKSVVYDL